MNSLLLQLVVGRRWYFLFHQYMQPYIVQGTARVSLFMATVLNEREEEEEGPLGFSEGKFHARTGKVALEEEI